MADEAVASTELPRQQDSDKKNLPKLWEVEQRYKDSNLEMTESESAALPFGYTPLFCLPLFSRDEGYYNLYGN